MGCSSELLAFSDMMLCNMSLVIVAVLVAVSGLPVGCPSYILAYPCMTPVGRGGATGHMGIVWQHSGIEGWLL